jgi:hypothetical protein
MYHLLRRTLERSGKYRPERKYIQTANCRYPTPVSPSGREYLIHALAKARSAQNEDRCRLFCWPWVFAKK